MRQWMTIVEAAHRFDTSVLTPDLLKPEYRERNADNPTYGHCYAAAEALFHLSGGAEGPWRPERGRDEEGVVHWWLRNKETGEILDPTAEQYTSVGKAPPYENGKPGGFLTRDPSKRAREIMRRLTEGAHITGLRPRFEQLGLTDNDLRKFAKNTETAEAFATRLAEPGTAAHEQLLQFWADCEAAGFPVDEETKFLIPYVGTLIANKLGATGYKMLPKGGVLPWAHSNLMGGDGYIITTPEGRVFLDATVEDNTIYMAQISAEDRGSGLGTKVMNAMREVAEEKGWRICVYKVTNHAFFRRFPWLEQTTPGTYVSV